MKITQSKSIMYSCIQLNDQKYRWVQTLHWVKDAEKVEDGVVDISRAQEGQTPGGPHQAGKTQQSEATLAGCTESFWVFPRLPLCLCSKLWISLQHLFHLTHARGHCHQYARVKDEYNGEIYQVHGVEECVICDPAAVKPTEESKK